MSWAETKTILNAIEGVNGDINTSMIVPFTENMYGFNLKVVDVDGITPIPNVKITGVSDPTTEIRTNAKGVVRFISSAATHTVYLSEFPSGFANVSKYQEIVIQGYINDMTQIVIGPNRSAYAGFDVTILDDTGIPVTNTEVTCSNGNKYNTNSNGVITDTIWHNGTSITITWSKGSESSYINGSLTSVTTPTKYSLTCNGSLGSVTTVKKNATKTQAGGTKNTLNVALAAGNTVIVGDYEYIITHVTDSLVYLALKTIPSDIVATVYSPYGLDDYTKSVPHSLCQTWYMNNVPEGWKTLNLFMAVHVYNSIGSRCCIPTYTEVASALKGWSYFGQQPAHCELSTVSGTTVEWWVRPDKEVTGVGYVSVAGRVLSSPTTSTTRYTRPCLAIDRTKLA